MSATTLVDARTFAIRAAVQKEQQKRQGEDFWESMVVVPSKELVKVLEVLNDSFTNGLILQVLQTTMSLSACICILLSKWFAAITGITRLLVNAVACFSVVLNMIPAVQCTMLLGAVSTSCDNLIEDLNILRLEDFNDDNDFKIFKLERALKNVNHGQGIGFKVGGLVLTKKVLYIMFAETVAMLSFVMPIVLSHSALGKVDEGDTSVAMGVCVLSEQQITIAKATFGVASGNCSYANMTIGAVLAM